jgi:hypothetical protein
MRLHCGPIPPSPDFGAEPPWQALREPSPWGFQFLAVPISLAVAAVMAMAWFTLTPLANPKASQSVIAIGGSFLGLIVVHELIHAACHPRAGLCPRSILGFWPSRCLFYAHYDGELPRNRLLVVLLMPLLVLSVLPLLVASLLQITSGWAAFLSILNAACACGDLLAAGMFAWQIPAGGILRNQGWRTYWRLPESRTTAAGLSV